MASDKSRPSARACRFVTLAVVDDLHLGRALRALRVRRQLRQRDLAELARASQQTVSLLERGQLERIQLPTARRIAGALEVSLSFEPRWRGGQLARLLDEEHARLVERVVARLRRAGWEVLIEYTFNHFGERGSVDVIGWQGTERSLLLVEVKSRLIDLQDTLGTFGKKGRIVPQLLVADRGWQARQVGMTLVAPDTTASRSIVSRHGATFAAALPGRAREIRAWLTKPRGRLAAVWFISSTHSSGGKRVTPGAQRVRRRN